MIALIVEAGHGTVAEAISQMCALATRMQVNVKCKNVGGHSIEVEPNKNAEEEFAKYTANAPRRRNVEPC
jgi:hypothetical protein